jgi:hypothetical protein
MHMHAPPRRSIDDEMIRPTSPPPLAVFSPNCWKEWRESGDMVAETAENLAGRGEAVRTSSCMIRMVSLTALAAVSDGAAGAAPPFASVCAYGAADAAIAAASAAAAAPAAAATAAGPTLTGGGWLCGDGGCGGCGGGVHGRITSVGIC